MLIYRFFDSDDRLLYVGVTTNFQQRMLAHRRQPWWPFVDRWTIDEVTHGEAYAREARAIADERPFFNVAGRDPVASRRAAATYKVTRLLEYRIEHGADQNTIADLLDALGMFDEHQENPALAFAIDVIAAAVESALAAGRHAWVG